MTLIHVPCLGEREANYYMGKQFPNYGDFAYQAALIHEVYMKTDSAVANEFAHKMLWKSLCGPGGTYGFIEPEQTREVVFSIMDCKRYVTIAANLIDKYMLDFLDLYKIKLLWVDAPTDVDFDDREGRVKAIAKAKEFLAENGWTETEDKYGCPVCTKA